MTTAARIPAEQDVRDWRGALMGLFLLGAALRIFAWQLTWPTGLVNDEVGYYWEGSVLAQNGVLETVRPPVTNLLNFVAIRLLGGKIPVIRVTGVIAGSLLVPVFFLVGREFGGRRIGLLAAALVAVYPNLIGFSHYLLSENYFVLFAFIALWLVMRQRARVRLAEVAVAGAMCGVAALTREVGLVLVIASALFVAWSSRASLGRSLLAAMILTVSAAAVIAPWSRYVYRETGAIVLVSQTTWLNLYLGNPPPGRGSALPWYEAMGKNPTEREAAARILVLDAIRRRMPYWPFQKLANIVPLFAPTTRTVRRLVAVPGENFGSLGEWAYRYKWPGLAPAGVGRAMAVLTATGYVAVVLLGCAGLVLARNRSAALFLAMVAIGFVVPVVLSFAGTRFRLPIEAILIVGSAPLLAEGPALWREASAARRIAALGVAVGMAVVIGMSAHTFLSPSIS